MSIAKAEAELRELHEKVETYQAFITNAKARINDLGIYIRIAGELGEGYANDGREALPRPSTSRESGRSREEGKTARTRSLSVEAVTRAGHAMLTRELMELLTPHGLTFGRGDPKSATGDLSSILGREPLLHNAGRSVGWTLAEWGEAHSAAEAEHRRKAADLDQHPSREAVDILPTDLSADTKDAPPPDGETASLPSDIGVAQEAAE